ncbi:hypothetical protein E2C01_077170 [Portunus trituberculatus]|uniref:Uncharacterized protein n=1 Tax=Portunus trituberculatus TaxID=210409 RepID=A0A5B7IKP5_PORTR|nr:hypothetical protein [Portunus trituberculatus]
MDSAKKTSGARHKHCTPGSRETQCRWSISVEYIPAHTGEPHISSNFRT